MHLLRLAFLWGVVAAGGIALFLGTVVMLTSWRSEQISWTYRKNGRDFTETVSRAVDADRFWLLYRNMGVFPAAAGAAAMAVGLIALRRRSTR